MNARTSYVATALVVVVLLGATGCSGGSTQPTPAGPGHAASPTTKPVAAPRTDAENAADARRAAIAALSRLRLPAGSVRLPGRPRGLANDVGFSPSTGPEAWFRVPMARAALKTYLFAHAPHGMPSDGSWGEGPATTSLGFFTRQAVTPAAFSGPDLAVEWGYFDGYTLLHVQSKVQVRHVRPSESLVPASVTSVAITRSGAARIVNGPTAQPAHATVTDAAVINQLRTAADRLYASFADGGERMCANLPDPALQYTVTFTGATTMTFTWRPQCFGQVTVVRDGRTLAPTLDPGAFATVVEQVLASQGQAPATP